jgi:hypothetical protein
MVVARAMLRLRTAGDLATDISRPNPVNLEAVTVASTF